MRYGPKKKKMNRFQRDAEARATKARFLSGEGLYIYKTNTKGTLILPKPLKDGRTRVEIGTEFEGDNYFMSLVRSNSLSLVREITSPDQERQQNMLNEEKLILDQPTTVTDKGAIEHVAAEPKTANQNENLQEGKPLENQNEVLLNDDPLDGVTILG